MPAPQAMGSLTTPTSNPSLRRGTSSPRLDTTTIRTCWTVECVSIQQTVGAGLDESGNGLLTRDVLSPGSFSRPSSPNIRKVWNYLGSREE